jgi:hypothetical protein
MKVVFKTRKRVARELKYSAMFREYNELLKDPNNDKMAVMGYLTKKHNVSQSCFYQYMRKQKKAQV